MLLPKNVGQSLVEGLVNSPIGAKVGVPQGFPLRRYEPGAPALEGPVVVGGPGRLAEAVRTLLAGDYHFLDVTAGQDAGVVDITSPRSAIVVDATSFARPEDLRFLYDFIHPQLKALNASGRIVVLGTTPELLDDVEARVVARSLEGFTRTLAKEMRKGSTVQLVYVAPDFDAATPAPLASTLRFLLSGKSAYVDGQVIRVSAGIDAPEPQQWDRPLEGRLSVVTGAARGIGATIAEVLARDGAEVICVDVPAAGEHLTETANRVHGTALPLDVTDPKAAETLAQHASQRYGRPIDVIVHNAGITRDKLLVNMDEARWDQVIAVNLLAPVRITEYLLEHGHLSADASVIGVSSMAGIAGNRGQTNYATTKAGIVGLVDVLAQRMAERGSTINAVAPGFIETAMTDAIPATTREIAKRMNSLQQGGKPVDVAETVAYFAQAASKAVNGNTVRVCGQNMLGA